MSTVKNKKFRNILIIAVIAVILIFAVLPFGISVYMYESVFGVRYSTQTDAYYAHDISEFEGLQRERYEFKSEQGNTLVGYRYFADGITPKAVVVIAHGFGGGGHNSYMDVAYYFVQNGYGVFAYDATGNDESEGDGVGGLPQGVMDLSRAITFAENIDAFNGLPILLFGHSWGGYSVSAVLTYNPEVKAIVSMAGFNRSSDLLKAQGIVMFGNVVNLLMPYVNIYEHLKFGEYADNTALDGFAASSAGIFIVHSEDDTTVPIRYGYDLYLEKYANNERFTFVRYESRGHNNVYYSEKSTLDEELFGKILDFYESNLA